MTNFDELATNVEKKFSKKPEKSKEVFFSTGIESFNNILGGGIPTGSITEIFGEQSTGKTSLSYNIIKEAQKNNLLCVYVDVERSFDKNYAEKLGVKLDSLFVIKALKCEDIFELILKLINDLSCNLIIIDSIAGFLPGIEKDMSFSDPYVLSHIIDDKIKKISTILNKTNISIVFTNQMRKSFDYRRLHKEKSSGSKYLKMSSDIRIFLKKSQTIKNKDVIEGLRITAFVSKNKFAPPFKSIDFNITTEKGITEA